MSVTSLYTLGLRQEIAYTMLVTIYRQIPTTGGLYGTKSLYEIATQTNSDNVSVQLIGIPGIFEPTVNTDQFVGVIGLVKDSNLITLNPFFIPVTIDIRDGDWVEVTQPTYALPWFVVNGEPKPRINQGLRTPNYSKVLLDPTAGPPPMVS